MLWEKKGLHHLFEHSGCLMERKRNSNSTVLCAICVLCSPSELEHG